MCGQFFIPPQVKRLSFYCRSLGRMHIAKINNGLENRSLELHHQASERSGKRVSICVFEAGYKNAYLACGSRSLQWEKLSNTSDLTDLCLRTISSSGIPFSPIRCLSGSCQKCRTRCLYYWGLQAGQIYQVNWRYWNELDKLWSISHSEQSSRFSPISCDMRSNSFERRCATAFTQKVLNYCSRRNLTASVVP